MTDQPPTRYHYTDVNAAASILNSFTVWFTNPRCLNDVNELAEGWRLLTNEVGVPKLGGAADLVSMFFGVCCLSKSPEILSQWRGYADDGAGIALGINPDAFMTSQCEVRDCVYVADQKAEVIAALVKKHGDYLRDLGQNTPADRFITRLESDDELLPIVCELLRLKNEAFVEEKEVRAIRRTHDRKEWKIRAANGLAIPYLEHSLSSFTHSFGDAVERNYAFPELWYGPKCTTRNRMAFELLIPRLGSTVDRFDCGYI